MSTYTKNKLKEAKEKIGKKDYESAEKAASDVLSFEPGNYTARVFLGLASLNLGKFEASEAAYKAAIDLQPQQPLARQGLAKFYEERQDWAGCVKALRELAQLFADTSDSLKCAETLQKIVELQRSHGDTEEIIEALSLLLPDSPFYATLSHLPDPDPTQPLASTVHSTQLIIQNSLPTLLEIVSMREKDEDLRIRNEVEKRRTRLTSGPTLSAEETRKSVRADVMQSSKLPDLYNEILSHPATADDLRYSTESKLLEYLYTHLTSLPSPFVSPPTAALSEAQVSDQKKEAKRSKALKDTLRSRVNEIAQGMVLLRLKDELAWRIAFDWTDVKDAESYDRVELGGFRELFPDHSLSKVIGAYLALYGFSNDREAEVPSLDEAALEKIRDDMETGFEASQKTSLLAHVLTTKFYLDEEDYQSVIELAEAGISLARKHENDSGRRYTHLIIGLQKPLALALTYLNPPSQHSKALRLVEELLTTSPDDNDLLLALGSIYEYSKRWADASEVYDRALGVLSLKQDEQGMLVARNERAWCWAKGGRYEEATLELQSVIDVMDNDEMASDEERAKVWWRLGQCLWNGEDDRKGDPSEAYKAYIQSIKRSPIFAPAFTSLGLYYYSISQPPDYSRASKCFQKAFELDPQERVAAKMLADEFASQSEWDLVEIIARRVLLSTQASGGAAMQGDLPRVGGAEAVKLAWAFRAIGSAELNSHRYPQAISAFQGALRGKPDDVHTWIKLGLAYRESGKHVAALKTFLKALELDPSSWYAKFCIGDIQRQTGLYDAAILTFEEILEERPADLGVSIILAETRLARGRTYLRSGLLARGEESLLKTLTMTLELIRTTPASRTTWKIAADALLELGGLEGTDIPSDLRTILKGLVDVISKEGVDAKIPSLTSVTAVGVASAIKASTTYAICVAMSVLASKIRVLLEIQNESSIGPAWMDLGLSLHSFKRHLSTLGFEGKKADVERQSIQCIRSALQKEPLNAVFWNALGCLTFEVSPRLCQHSFIRSIELSTRSAIPWTNLGIFYLTQEENDLANQAFLKAQVLDPDWAPAWVGQAILASLNGDEVDSRTLSEHAFNLAGGGILEADLSYATQTFSAYKLAYPASNSSAASILSGPLFALERYLSRRPNSSTILNLHALVCETLCQLESASASLEKAAGILEAKYEETESVDVERRYIIAQANLARILLSVGNYDGSIEAGESVKGLTVDFEPGDEEGRNLRKNVLVVEGLSWFWKDDFEKSLEVFQDCLEGLLEDDRKGRREIGLWIAKVLWAMGGEEQREEAKRQLLDIISQGTDEESSSGANLPSISALAAMAIIKGDDDLLDAAISEIVKLPADVRAKADPQGEVDWLLERHHLMKDDIKGATSVTSRSLHLSPTSLKARQNLSTLLLQSLPTSPPRSKSDILKTALSTISASFPSTSEEDSVGRLKLKAYIRGQEGEEEGGEEVGVRLAQKSVRLRPWDTECWNVLGNVARKKR